MSKKHHKTQKQIKQQQKQQQTRLSALVAVMFFAAVAFMIFGNTFTAPQPVDTANLMIDAPQRISPQDYVANFEQSDEDYVLIDVRTPREVATGAIAGAINIPVEELSRRMDEVPDDKPVVIYCNSGNRSNTAARILDRAGYSGVYDLGGIIQWQRAGYEIE